MLARRVLLGLCASPRYFANWKLVQRLDGSDASARTRQKSGCGADHAVFERAEVADTGLVRRAVSIKQAPGPPPGAHGSISRGTDSNPKK
jgi:hypothetical protein